jgi:hypothetical protein
MLTWEWYDDPPTKTVYLHLILTASISPSIWHGVEIPRGSLISSYRKIAEQTGLTIRQARTAINHLETTGEVTRSAYPKFTVFTLNNYDKFQEATSKTQGKRSNTDKQPDKQPTSNRQQYKNIKEDIKKEENISAVAQDEKDVRIFPPGGDF